MTKHPLTRAWQGSRSRRWLVTALERSRGSRDIATRWLDRARAVAGRSRLAGQLANAETGLHSSRLARLAAVAERAVATSAVGRWLTDDPEHQTVEVDLRLSVFARPVLAALGRLSSMSVVARSAATVRRFLATLAGTLPTNRAAVALRRSTVVQLLRDSLARPPASSSRWTDRRPAGSGDSDGDDTDDDAGGPNGEVTDNETGDNAGEDR